MESAPDPRHVWSDDGDPHVGDDVVARMRADLRTAMKARDRSTAAALRSVLAAVQNASAIPTDEGTGPLTSAHVAGAAAGLGAAEAARRHLEADDVAEVVRAEVSTRREAADEYAAAGRSDHAARLRSEADTLAAYLSPSE